VSISYYIVNYGPLLLIWICALNALMLGFAPDVAFSLYSGKNRVRRAAVGWVVGSTYALVTCSGLMSLMKDKLPTTWDGGIIYFVWGVPLLIASVGSGVLMVGLGRQAALDHERRLE
jgi:hypothetical protein